MIGFIIGFVVGVVVGVVGLAIYAIGLPDEIF